LVQAFLKKWWVESDFKAPNLPFHYGSKLTVCDFFAIAKVILIVTYKRNVS
jgi:hypothetical protein